MVKKKSKKKQQIFLCPYLKYLTGKNNNNKGEKLGWKQVSNLEKFNLDCLIGGDNNAVQEE